MKILYVSNGSNFLSAGGMEYHLVDITNWLEKRGVDIAMGIRKGTLLHEKLLQDRANIYPLSWTGPRKIFSFLQFGKSLIDFSPDIISVNRERDIIRIYYIVKFMSLFLRKRPKLAAVFHNLGWRSSFNLDKLDGIIFPNTYIKNDYIHRSPAAEAKSQVIYHGIRLPQTDRALKLNPDRERKYFKGIKFPLIGMIGELRKNQEELIEVARCLKNHCASFTFAFIGRGSDEQIHSLRKQIDHAGLSQHIIITGGVERHLMPDIYFDLDLSVTTNRREPFGLTFIESIASYTPVIAYNSGGPVEILHKGGGILVDGGSEQMAQKMCMLISDGELRRSMAIAGREAAEKYFSIDAMGGAHYRFYASLLRDGYLKSMSSHRIATE